MEIIVGKPGFFEILKYSVIHFGTLYSLAGSEEKSGNTSAYFRPFFQIICQIVRGKSGCKIWRAASSMQGIGWHALGSGGGKEAEGEEGWIAIVPPSPRIREKRTLFLHELAEKKIKGRELQRVGKKQKLARFVRTNAG